MSIIGCDAPFPISGGGKASYSFCDTAAAAIASAIQQAQREGDLLATAESFQHQCRNECPTKSVSAANIKITKQWSTWARLSDLVASLFWGEWKYSGHVEFTWSATITCTGAAHHGQDTGGQKPATDPPVVDPKDDLFIGDSSDLFPDISDVKVTDPGSGRPAKDIPVKFKVEAGPFRFEDGSQQAVIPTDQSGRARISGRFSARGVTRITAEASEFPGPEADIRGYSEGMTHLLSGDAPPCTTADNGRLSTVLHAVDFHGDPVCDALLIVEASYPEDVSRTVITGTAEPDGKGGYRILAETRIAGPLSLFVQDRLTKASWLSIVPVVPAPAAKFAILGSKDPRDSEPYGHLLLRAQLQDSYSNPIDPSRIRCTAAGQPLARHAIVETEARFIVAHAGSGVVPIILSDERSQLSHALEVSFAAAWLGRPGAIFEGDTYLLPVYVAAPADAEVGRVRVNLKLDNRLATFEGFVKSGDIGGPVEFAYDPENNTASIQFDAATGCVAPTKADGLYIGDLRCACKGRGTTCFLASTVMSPESSKWELCLPQKEKLGIACICVNMIYPPKAKWKNEEVMNRVLDKIESEAKDLGTIVSANVGQCCPFLRIDVSRTELSGDEYQKIRDILQGGKITSASDSQKFSNPKNFPEEGIEFGIKANCINLYLWPFSSDNPNYRERGDTHVGPVEGRTGVKAGRGVIDPAVAAGSGHHVPHELGHALGLTHASAALELYNLMTNSKSRGTNLSQSQCRTIWEHLDHYPCAHLLAGVGHP